MYMLLFVSAEQAFPNKWFVQRGMLIRSKDQLPHWLSDTYWVHLT